MTSSASEGPVVLVTGAASGIGRATVEHLRAREARVVAVDRQPIDLEALASLEGDGFRTFAADVSDESQVRKAFDFALEAFGRLDGLYNNAGILGEMAPVEEYRIEEFDRVLRVNLGGVFFGMKYAVPIMRRQGYGAILSTASTGGMIGSPNQAAYIASKHAVLGLTRTVALETARDGITVNAICPGMVDTPMLWSVWEGRGSTSQEDLKKEIAKFSPTGRMSSPDEIAQAAAWLLLDRPVYLTGAVIPVDGAQTSE